MAPDLLFTLTLLQAPCTGRAPTHELCPTDEELEERTATKVNFCAAAACLPYPDSNDPNTNANPNHCR